MSRKFKRGDVCLNKNKRVLVEVVFFAVHENHIKNDDRVDKYWVREFDGAEYLLMVTSLDPVMNEMEILAWASL